MDDKDIDSIIAERQKELSVLSGSSLPPKKSVGKTDDIANIEVKAPPEKPTIVPPEKESLSEIIAETAELKAREASSHVAAELIMAEAKLEFALLRTKDQINELTRELAEMKRKMEQAALNA
jgi:hypothetical protein